VCRRLGGTEGDGKSRGVFYFSIEEKNENHQFGTGFCVHHRMSSAVKMVEFVNGECHV